MFMRSCIFIHDINGSDLISKTAILLYDYLCVTAYIDMNMVRTGAVDHPAEWEHTAYHEFINPKQRYRIVNMQRLLECLNFSDEGSFRNWYNEALAKQLVSEHNHREIYWSRATAIGNESWLPQASKDAGLKRCTIKKFKTSSGEEISYL